ncbi:hypothetical protein N8I77_012662 [Diaporthe amygdali]|uniref:DUF8021 domain-containing protein n=1 Tax=Phomopsis amygdali TaxID=1214568 RepID=A0AAD9S412_PHOAM|nr:hypothetical protein N8I77_012662 [Diaporthe amygdali]
MIWSSLHVLALFLAALEPASAACDRATLKNVTDTYIAAQTAGSLTPLAGLLNGTTYHENYKTATISSGILSQALKIDHNRTTLDTTQCASFAELIVANSAHPYVIGTQLYLSNSTTEPQTISKIDTIVTDQGDWLFNATGTLYWASRENWGSIATASRDTRKTIQAAADAYLDYFKDKSVVVPWGTPCARLEGGSYTGKGAATDSCNVGVPSGVSLTDRRYIIDEEVGEVDVFLSFEGAPDTHDFRIEGGKIRYVHTMTVM